MFTVVILVVYDTICFSKTTIYLSLIQHGKPNAFLRPALILRRRNLGRRRTSDTFCVCFVLIDFKQLSFGTVLERFRQQLLKCHVMIYRLRFWSIFYILFKCSCPAINRTGLANLAFKGCQVYIFAMNNFYLSPVTPPTPGL